MLLGAVNQCSHGFLHSWLHNGVDYPRQSHFDGFNMVVQKNLGERQIIRSGVYGGCWITRTFLAKNSNSVSVYALFILIEQKYMYIHTLHTR